MGGELSSVSHGDECYMLKFSSLRDVQVGNRLMRDTCNSILTVHLLFPVHLLLVHGKDVLWKSLKTKFFKLKQNRQFTYKRITEARSCNQFYSATAISITYSESVFVALGIQHALWSVRLYDIFPHYFKNGTIFYGGGMEFLNMKYGFWFFIFSTTSVLNTSHSVKNSPRHCHKCA
jgi:hypothetical protein